MRAVLLRCLAVAFLLLCSESARAAHAGVALIVTSPAAEPAARYFATQIEEPVTRRSSEHTRRLDILVVEARLYWPERLVVVIDLERATVSAARPADGTVATRVLTPDALRAPYAVALAASELLELVDAKPLPRPPPAPAPGDPAPEPVQPAPRSRVSPTVAAGLEVSQSTNGDVGLIQPTVGVDLRFMRDDSPFWFSAGVHAGGLVGRSRRLTLAVADGSDRDATADYDRNQIALHGAFAHEASDGAVVAYLDVGLSGIRVTARDGSGRTVAQDERLAFFSGVGGELRRSIVGPLWLGVGAGIAVFPVTSHFLASPENSGAKIAAFEEGHLETRVRLTLLWVLSR